MKAKFISKQNSFGDFSLEFLTYGKEYKVQTAKHGLFRVVDDTGEAYLYPQGFFEEIKPDANRHV